MCCNPKVTDKCKGAYHVVEGRTARVKLQESVIKNQKEFSAYIGS